LRVWRQRELLDTALADGAEPDEDAAIALRAHQLIDPRTRRSIAAAIRSLVDDAADPPRALGAEPPLRRGALLAARGDLLEIAERMDGGVSPQAAALASLLVWDSASPLYDAHAEASVEQWARAVLAAG
jgi:hypothetical protein